MKKSKNIVNVVKYYTSKHRNWCDSKEIMEIKTYSYWLVLRALI